MLNKIKNRKQEGFTIIEVLIVLAIAGLIMLIVFLAVPALQRNSRNTQRTNDAALISSAVNECLNNNNGQIDQCRTPVGTKLADYIATDKIQQLTDSSSAAGINGYQIDFGNKCDANGADKTQDGASARSYTVTFKTETSGTTQALRCVGS